MDHLFFELIQIALGTRSSLGKKPSDEEWPFLFEWCEKHAITGFVFPSLNKLSEQGQKPPADLLFEWIGLYEQIRGQNTLLNTEAARLTALFEEEGHRTAILKGQANALLYPNPQSRQPGDIDIWVDGGKERVVKTLVRRQLTDGALSRYHSDNAEEGYHHILLPMNENGIVVEVHFRPSSGNQDPFTNRRLQKFLNQEIDRENELTKEGFRVPSLAFALVMQLAHIQRHLIDGGIGLRQIIDYYFLLKSGNNNQLIIENGKLKCLGLDKIAGALMWVLHEKLGMEEKYLIVSMDERRGRMMLEEIMAGGNFGQYSPEKQQSFSINGKRPNLGPGLIWLR